MDDDNSEDMEQPSTSKKKETPTTHSKENAKYNTEVDEKSVSKTTVQSSLSDKSRRNSEESVLMMPKDSIKDKRHIRERDERIRENKNIRKRTRDSLKNSKKECITGRIDKNKQFSGKRQMTRRAPQRKIRSRGDQRKRELSLSTIASRLSSGSRTPGCTYCGHRCCRRR